MLQRSECIVLWLTCCLVYQGQIANALPFGASNPWNEKEAGEPIWRRATFSSIVEGPVNQPASPVSTQPNSGSSGPSSFSFTSSTSSSSQSTSSFIHPVTVTTTIPPVTSDITVVTLSDPPAVSTSVDPPVETTTTTAANGMEIIDAPLVIIAQSIVFTSIVVVPNAASGADPTTIVKTITTTTELTMTTTTTDVETLQTNPLTTTTRVQLENGPVTIIIVGPQTIETYSPATSTEFSETAPGPPATMTESPETSTADPAVPTESVGGTFAEGSQAAPSTTSLLVAATTTVPVVPTVLTTPAPPPNGTTVSGSIVESSAIIFPVFSSLTAVAASASPTVTVTATGSINTALPTGGKVTVVPFPNGTITQATISLAPTSLIGTSTIVQLTPISDNIFVPIATDAPPAYIPVKGNHPVQGIGVVGLGNTPVETNKFYTNLMVGDQTFNAFPYPYSIHWAKGTGGSGSWGLAIEHVERSQIVFGSGNPPSYYVNPLGLDSVVLSAAELGNGASLTTDTHRSFSVNVNLLPSGSNTPLITFPVVQGMGFTTAIYNDASVLIQSGISFKQLSPVTQVGATSRWLVLLEDGHEWGIWITPSNGGAVGNLTLSTGGITITGPTGFSGIIQVAKIENQGEETIYDNYAGGFGTGVNISANAQGEYSFVWSKGGDTSKTLVNWALPHHMQSFTSETSSAQLNLTLNTLTAGAAIAIAADVWMLQENLPTEVGFEPWAPSGINGVSFGSLADSVKNLITSVATSELGQDMNAQCNLNTLYFSGKGFAKFAMAVYTAANLLNNTNLADSGLAQLENVFNNFIQNNGQSTFAYDNVWKGIVDPAGYTGGSGADFGNTYYNDHMFHYGYFVYSAAVIAYLDPGWLTQNSNKDFIDSLVRDYSNSIEDDPYFPFSRNFDWYRGHSWAGGLFPISDGKDLESTSEDTFASYAVKMWGKATGDANMEARGEYDEELLNDADNAGNLMLAVQARALNNYVFMQDDNTVQPSQYIPNKVAGISFQNKMDHTTYFGTNIEYIEGIHMIPVAAHTGFIRPAAFISQEWSTYFDNGRVDAIDSGWKGILYADYTFVDPQTAWDFFSQANFPQDWLDGGASQTWYLALAAMLGGSG